MEAIKITRAREILQLIMNITSTHTLLFFYDFCSLRTCKSNIISPLWGTRYRKHIVEPVTRYGHEVRHWLSRKWTFTSYVLSALHRPDHLRPAFDLSEEATERERENKKRQMMKKTARKRKRVVTLVAYIRTQLSPSFSLSLSLSFSLPLSLLCLTRRHYARSCRDVNGSQTYATFP